MSESEWESLCDGCGRCCLQKLVSSDDDTIVYTRVACRLLDTHSCRCGDYANRRAKVAECISLEPGNVEALSWLPDSCGYVRVWQGRDLADWHPLVSGNPESVHEAGISMRGKAVSEHYIHPDDFESMIIDFAAD